MNTISSIISIPPSPTIFPTTQQTQVAHNTHPPFNNQEADKNIHFEPFRLDDQNLISALAQRRGISASAMSETLKQLSMDITDYQNHLKELKLGTQSPNVLAAKSAFEAQFGKQENLPEHTVWRVDGKIIGAHFDIGWTTFSNGADGRGNAQDKSNSEIKNLPASERNDRLADAMTQRLREKYGARLQVETQQPDHALKYGYVLNEMQS